jgi:transketolase
MKLDSAKRDAIIPRGAKKVSLEAGVTVGWERIVGSDGLLLGINHYGASAPGELLAEKFGFTPTTVAEKAGKHL